MKLPRQTDEEIQEIRDDVYDMHWKGWKKEDERQRNNIIEYIYE